jgi:hypothetical protein
MAIQRENPRDLEEGETQRIFHAFSLLLGNISFVAILHANLTEKEEGEDGGMS